MGTEQKPQLNNRTRLLLETLARTMPHPYAAIKATYEHLNSLDQTIELATLASKTGRHLADVLALVKQGYALRETGAKPIEIAFKVTDNGNVSIEFNEAVQFLIFSELEAMGVAKNLIETADKARQMEPMAKPYVEQPTPDGKIIDPKEPNPAPARKKRETPAMFPIAPGDNPKG